MLWWLLGVNLTDGIDIYGIAIYPATLPRIARPSQGFAHPFGRLGEADVGGAEHRAGVAVAEGTTFAGDLEWDSLTVMDFVAAVEDEFDIVITMNMQAEIETVGQLADAVGKLNNQTA